MEFAYITLDAFWGALWVLMYLLRPTLRKEMFVVSIFLTPLAFIAPILAVDYFRPEYVLPLGKWMGIEDILFVFFAGGVASVAYKTLFRHTKLTATHKPRIITFAVMYVIGFAAFLTGTLALGLPSIITGCVLLAIMGSIQVGMRPDLSRSGIVSSLLTLAVLFCSYKLWLTIFYPDFLTHSFKTTLYVSGIPYQEYLWALAWGFYAGPVYNFIWGQTSHKG